MAHLPPVVKQVLLAGRPSQPKRKGRAASQAAYSSTRRRRIHPNDAGETGRQARGAEARPGARPSADSREDRPPFVPSYSAACGVKSVVEETLTHHEREAWRVARDPDVGHAAVAAESILDLIRGRIARQATDVHTSSHCSWFCCCFLLLDAACSLTQMGTKGEDRCYRTRAKYP